MYTGGHTMSADFRLSNIKLLCLEICFDFTELILNKELVDSLYLRVGEQHQQDNFLQSSHYLDM